MTQDNDPRPEETPDESMRRLQGEQPNEAQNGGTVPPPPAGEPYGTPQGGWGAPPPYAGAPYGAPPAPAAQAGGIEHPKTMTVLLLGIFGILCCAGILSPLAWILGDKYRKEVAANPGLYKQDQTTLNIGWILGIIGTVLFVLGLLFQVAGLAMGS